MRENSLLKKLQEGRGVAGAFCSIPSPSVVEILGLAGMDFVIVDSEHSPILPLDAENMYRAAELTGIVPITRIGENSQQVIQKFLDAGTMGIQIPLVDTGEDAKKVVDAARYPPKGKRGLAGSRAASYGLAEPMDQYVETANKQIIVIVQVETVLALENIEEISGVEGVDIVFMGPGDLSSSFGIHGQTRHPDVLKRIEEAGNVVQKAGKIAGTLGRDIEEYAYWRDRGFQYLCTKTPGLLGGATRNYLTPFRDYEIQKFGS